MSTPLDDIAAQGELSLDLDAAIEAEARAHGEGAGDGDHAFTGRLVAKRTPERYRLFCSLYFDAGLGQMQVCELLHMSPQTGAAIIAAECAGRTADELRARQAARGRAVVMLALGAIQERLSDPKAAAEIPVRDLTAVIQRAGELALLQEGGATKRVEHVSKKSDVTEDDVREYMSRNAFDGEVMDAGPRTEIAITTKE